MSRTVAGVPLEAPELPRPVIFDQQWTNLTFLHWPVQPGAVARWMPPGARVDRFEGRTYVGLVPFAMRDARIGSSLPAPWVGTFGEVNVRLYSVDDEGRHGVVFVSLDADRLATVAVARALGVPYVRSRIRIGSDGPVHRYEVRRRGRGRANDPRSARSLLSVRVGERVEPTDLERWLTARWGMHSAFAGRPVWVPNHHGEWALHAAEILRLDDGLVTSAGITPAGPMRRPLWSPGVHSRFGRPGLGGMPVTASGVGGNLVGAPPQLNSGL